MTVAVRFAYDGGAFDSYARNPGSDTVEGALIAAFSREGLVDGTFRTGSRTDARVSALENVASATFDRPHIKGLLPSLQRSLPSGLWMTGAARVGPGWNPRHAKSRTYRLLLPNRGESQAAMRRAAACFVGRHDMTAFARVEAGRDPERTVLAFTVAKAGRDWAFRVRGESFLWGQVRRMVGAALAVGRGDADSAAVVRSLATGKPHPRFVTAPASGLLLERVRYANLRWDAAAGRVARDAPDVAAAMRTRAAVAAHVAKLARSR